MHKGKYRTKKGVLHHCVLVCHIPLLAYIYIIIQKEFKRNHSKKKGKVRRKMCISKFIVTFAMHYRIC